MKLPPLILASASPRRAELLRQLQPEFQVIPSDATEMFDDQLSPRELCQLNAHRKACAVAKKISDAQQRKDALVSARLPLDLPDRCNEDVLNRILWRAMRGSREPYPVWAVVADED